MLSALLYCVENLLLSAEQIQQQIQGSTQQALSASNRLNAWLQVKEVEVIRKCSNVDSYSRGMAESNDWTSFFDMLFTESIWENKMNVHGAT